MLSVKGYALAMVSCPASPAGGLCWCKTPPHPRKRFCEKKAVRRRSAVSLRLRTAVAAFSQKRQKITMLLCAVKYRLTSAYLNGMLIKKTGRVSYEYAVVGRCGDGLHLPHDLFGRGDRPAVPQADVGSDPEGLSRVCRRRDDCGIGLVPPDSGDRAGGGTGENRLDSGGGCSFWGWDS